VQDSRRGAKQTAYEITVSTDETFATAVWATGKVESDQSTHVEYAGPALQSGRRYYWRVRTWDAQGKPSEWSKPAWFEMGLLSPADWKARWITAEKKAIAASAGEEDKQNGPRRSFCLRKEFEAKGKPVRARAYVTGLGVYKLYINGKPVGDDILSPGWTDYRKRVQYQTYDVTEQIDAGVNAVGAILGNGWWSGGLAQSTEAYSSGNLRLLMQLAVEYADGTQDLIVTDDKGWKAHASPITQDSLYHGETYDARLEMPGWAASGFDAAAWTNAVLVPEAEQKIAVVADVCEPIRVTQELPAVWVNEHETDKGTFIFDFGQNAAGFVRLKARGGAGTKIRLRFGEELDPNGRLYRDNYRSAQATDYYICKGQGEEVWEPLFTYRGMRYCEVTGYPGRPANDALIFRVFHTDVPQAGVFECSHPLLTQLFKNIMWGQRSNLHSVPTDCPQRDERLGWTGDVNVFGPTSCWNMDMAAFYHKWMQDVIDSRGPEGWVTDVAPAMVTMGPAAPGWGDACVTTPYTVWQFYGDTQIIEKSFDTMVGWIEYMHANRESRTGLYERKGYGDWVATVESPSHTIGAAYYYYSTKLVSEMARAIGRSAEADKYAKRAEEIAALFNKHYLNAETNQYAGETQTANLLPLYFGIVPPDRREAVLNNIVENIKARGYHLSTGFLGTAYLMSALADGGRQDVAGKLATQTSCPSWLYMLLNGATTMWERWDTDKWGPNMNSRNHYAFGAIGRWMMEDVAGIRFDPTQPGFKHIIIRPQPTAGLTWASASYASMYGDVKSAWRHMVDDGRDVLTLNVTVPANTRARVHVPTLGRADGAVYESGKLVQNVGGARGKVEKVPGVTPVAVEGGFVIFDVGAGKYEFRIEGR
nr:family 78 glycoside hydrolase catalytic domain [Phycisphaerae bacterium]